MPRATSTEPSSPRVARSALRSLIREAMRAKGIEAIDGEQGLARRVGIARNTIYAWETGAYPRIGELERLGRFLGVPAWQLLRAWEQVDGADVKAVAEQAAGYGLAHDARIGVVERKLDVLLARSGIDPVDVEDEAEAERLIARAREELGRREQEGAAS